MSFDAARHRWLADIYPDYNARYYSLSRIWQAFSRHGVAFSPVPLSTLSRARPARISKAIVAGANCTVPYCRRVEFVVGWKTLPVSTTVDLEQASHEDRIFGPLEQAIAAVVVLGLGMPGFPVSFG